MPSFRREFARADANGIARADTTDGPARADAADGAPRADAADGPPRADAADEPPWARADAAASRGPGRAVALAVGCCKRLIK